ncbi:MAG: type IV secretion system DNA-binding domain-containing protein [Candidatus Paceibacterota bacterium]|jgi:hypothetical protein
MSDQDKITYIGETDFRNKKIKFGIKAKDRTRHVYIIGKTGMGKSTLLENMAVQDIVNGEGMAFIDPHGGTAEKLLDYIPESRVKDVIYFAPFDADYPVSFNVMEDVGADKRHLVANGLMNAFKKIWVDAWSARMEYILNNVLLALLEYPDSTILGVNRMLSDKDYRNLVVANVTDASVKSFWVDEFAKYGDKYMQEAGAAIQNKIGQFISNPLIRNIIGQPKSSFDIRKIMDEKKILIMNLSKGRMGIENSTLLGNMLVTKIYLGAMSRADASASLLQKLPNFYFYVDEFQSFANESFADILSEARKYKLSLTIAHQYVNQMPEEVRDAVFGNVGSMVTFRIGPEDAELFEKEFAPEFIADDLVNLGFSQIYLRLMIDGIGSKPFSATTLPPIAQERESHKDEVIDGTRKIYATPRTKVEGFINKWYESVAPPKAPRERKDKDAPEQPASPREFKNDVAGSGSRPAPDKKPVDHIIREEIKVGHTTPVAPREIPHEAQKWPTMNDKAGVSNVDRTPKNRPFIAKIEPKPITPVSLSQLKPEAVKGQSRNSMALKEALAAALKEKVAVPFSSEPKKEVPTSSVPQNIPEATDGGLRQEEKKWEEMKKHHDTPKAPKEIPEDVLRKILNE